jgi:hypothetical protein
MAAVTGLLIAGLALSAYGQVRQGMAQRSAGDAAQRAAESEGERLDYNARVADMQAADAISRGQDEESRFRTQVRGLIGTQRAGFAGQGVDVNVGSAVDVQADTAALGEQDALTIRSDAQRAAWGFQQQATDMRLAADVARRGGNYAASAGRAAATSSYIGAGGTVLGGAGSIMLSRYGYRNDTLPSGRVRGASSTYNMQLRAH